MVRYLFYTIGDLTYQSPLVQNLPGLWSMAFHIISIRHRHTECLYEGYILTAGSDGSDSSSAGVATNYSHGHDEQGSQCWTIICSK